MKKLALFDLDGTLFNTCDVNFYAYQAALKEKNLDINYDYYCKYCNGRHYSVFIPQITSDKETIEYVHNRKKQFYSEYLSKAIINEHLFNIIECIKSKYYCAIVTTASRKNTEDILGYFDKGNLFDLILTGDEIKNSKPDPEGFITAINYFKVDAKDTIVFEDSEVGIEAARKTGATVFVANKF